MKRREAMRLLTLAGTGLGWTGGAAADLSPLRRGSAPNPASESPPLHAAVRPRRHPSGESGRPPAKFRPRPGPWARRLVGRLESGPGPPRGPQARAPSRRADGPVDLCARLCGGRFVDREHGGLDRNRLRPRRAALGSARPCYGFRPSPNRGPAPGPGLGHEQQARPDFLRRRSGGQDPRAGRLFPGQLQAGLRP